MRHVQKKRIQTPKKVTPIRPGSPLHLALARIAEQVAITLDVKLDQERKDGSVERRESQ
jgi:hypothetical protein